MLSEFKKFAIQGNVIDMAVGFIIGGAFGGIVSSLVNDVIMPPVGMALGGIDFKDYFIKLKDAPEITTLAAAKTAGIPVIAYGQFVNVALNFLILAFIIFIMVKQINRLKKEAPAPPPPPPPRSETLLEEIRDLLKKS